MRIDASRIDLALDETTGRHVGALEMAFFCADARQSLVGQVWKKMDFKLTDGTRQRLLSGGFTYSTEVLVKEPPRFVKVVVYDYGPTGWGRRSCDCGDRRYRRPTLALNLCRAC